MNRKTLTYAGAGAAAVVAAGLFFTSSFSAAETAVAELAEKTHVHGIAVERDVPSRLMPATHQGFHVGSADGVVKQVSDTSDDFTGFTPHPKDSSVLYASDHPQRGGNTGFIARDDEFRKALMLMAEKHELAFARRERTR